MTLHAATDATSPATTQSTISPTPANQYSARNQPMRAPSPYADSLSGSDQEDYTSDHEPSFSIHAPSGLTDSDSDREDYAISSRRRSSVSSVRNITPVQVALAEVTEQLQLQLKLKTERRVSELDRALLTIEATEQQALRAAVEERKNQLHQLESADKRLAAQRTVERDRLLQSLRVQHEKKAAEQEQKLKARLQEEQSKKDAAACAAAAKAEAERKATEAAAAAKQAAATAAAAAQKQIAVELENKEKVAALLPDSAAKDVILNIAPSAAEFHKRCAEALANAQLAVKPFVDDKSMRDAKRSIDKFVTLNVQQISATLEQVRSKGTALLNFIGQQRDIQKTYALLTLAKKLLSQCEVQITRLHAFAFPLAEVAAAVASMNPEFTDLLLAQLHQACPLTVPAYYGLRSGGDDTQYLQLLGYKVSEEGKPESTDEFVGRMQGYIMLYAAITQSDNPRNPHGLTFAWAWLARLLNALPADRITAVALDAFLKVAGFKLHGTYKGQFMKLLRCVHDEYLPDLSKSGDNDARAVYTRLATYLDGGRFAQPPEGRNMPASDMSSRERA